MADSHICRCYGATNNQDIHREMLLQRPRKRPRKKERQAEKAAVKTISTAMTDYNRSTCINQT